MILLDTCILIDYLRGDKKVIAELNKIGNENICVNDVILMELFRGAINKSDLKFIKNSIKEFYILEINQNIIGLAKNIIERYFLSHHTHIEDSIIAATALVYDLSLYTYNLKDYDYIQLIDFYHPSL
jgi:tRNA(fMet)-specific endonuclease VapC